MKIPTFVVKLNSAKLQSLLWKLQMTSLAGKFNSFASWTDKSREQSSYQFHNFELEAGSNQKSEQWTIFAGIRTLDTDLKLFLLEEPVADGAEVVGLVSLSHKEVGVPLQVVIHCHDLNQSDLMLEKMRRRWEQKMSKERLKEE